MRQLITIRARSPRYRPHPEEASAWVQTFRDTVHVSPDYENGRSSLIQNLANRIDRRGSTDPRRLS
jgi:hypothetical protein